jgi:hypothetical protein
VLLSYYLTEWCRVYDFFLIAWGGSTVLRGSSYCRFELRSMLVLGATNGIFLIAWRGSAVLEGSSCCRFELRSILVLGATNGSTYSALDFCNVSMSARGSSVKGEYLFGRASKNELGMICASKTETKSGRVIGAS